MRLCIKCDGEVDASIVAKWGDTVPRQRFAPFICAWCGSILLVDLATQKLIDPEKVKEETGMDVLVIMRRNFPLWKAISDTRTRVLAMPNRRPVLR